MLFRVLLSLMDVKMLVEWGNLLYATTAYGNQYINIQKLSKSVYYINQLDGHQVHGHGNLWKDFTTLPDLPPH